MDIKFICNVLFGTKRSGLFLINVNCTFEKFVLKMFTHGTEILERKGTKNEDYPIFFCTINTRAWTRNIQLVLLLVNVKPRTTKLFVKFSEKKRFDFWTFLLVRQQSIRLVGHTRITKRFRFNVAEIESKSRYRSS